MIVTKSVRAGVLLDRMQRSVSRAETLNRTANVFPSVPRLAMLSTALALHAIHNAPVTILVVLEGRILIVIAVPPLRLKLRRSVSPAARMGLIAMVASARLAMSSKLCT